MGLSLHLAADLFACSGSFGIPFQTTQYDSNTLGLVSSHTSEPTCDLLSQSPWPRKQPLGHPIISLLASLFALVYPPAKWRPTWCVPHGLEGRALAHSSSGQFFCQSAVEPKLGLTCLAFGSLACQVGITPSSLTLPTRPGCLGEFQQLRSGDRI